MFVTALFVQALLATATLAIPTAKERFEKRVARRAETANLNITEVARQSHPVKLVDAQGVKDGDDETHPEFSSNWAGVVLASPEGTYKQVSASFSVPTVKEPAGETGGHAASAWVGIDGYSCPNAILQAGLDFIIVGDQQYYSGWYEWFPDYSHDFQGISFKPDDEVTITVTATSPSTGTIVIVNDSTGEAVTQHVGGPDLCGQDAEWIVEDFVAGGQQVPLANFGTVTFTDAVATTEDNAHVGPNSHDAHILDILLDGVIYTETSASAETVTVRYTQ